MSRNAEGAPVGVRVGAATFVLGALATLVCVGFYATGAHGSSSPTWLATAAAILTPAGLAIAFGALWRDHRREVRALRDQ